MPGVSINPKTFVEGGAVPVDRNLKWTEVRWAIFDYTKRDGTVVASTLAARVTYKDDDGQEYVQHYSAGDKEKFNIINNGKSLEPKAEGAALSKSSNFYILMNAAINAGVPENKLGDDISVLDGLYTHNIGMPEPNRAGLASSQPREDGRTRVISVPDKILSAPWDKGAAKAGAKAEAPADNTAEAVAFVSEFLAGKDEVTRQQVAAAAIRAKKPAVSKAIFTKEIKAALEDAGMTLDGEKITAAG